ncbi:MAG TPA: HAMP domain-containing sensor histidine kinase [Longimicrobiaceae bacterium]
MPETGLPVRARAADPLARISSPVLRSAARQVLAGLAGGGGDEEELAARLAELALGVEDARAAGPAAPDPDGPSSRELLELLMEAELAARYRDGAPPSLPELLRVVQSFRAPAAAPSPDGLPGFDDPSVVVGLAHDLRSPLTSVLFLSDALRSGYAGDPSDAQRRQLGIIYSAALGLVSMANDILDLYRRGDELVDEHPSAFSLREIGASIGDIVRPIAEERRVELRFALEGEDRRLGHPVALARVLLNLVVNGLKYTESGFVEVSAVPLGGDAVELAVRDSGAGIRPEQEAMLFQPVRRVSRWNGPGFSGTGLGLTLARNLVRAMGSDLAYETAAGVGTRFHFRLDLPPAPES